MTAFAYRARDERGLLVTGNLEAASKRDVYAQLDNMGLIPVAAAESRKTAFAVDAFMMRFQRIKDDDLIFFTRQLQTIIRSGIPMVSGLRALEEQTSNERLSAAIKTVGQDIDRAIVFLMPFQSTKEYFPNSMWVW